MEKKDSFLQLSTIFKFWIPLAATWLMMSVEGPFIAAVIARMGDPKFNLAAYGVAFSFALIVESPIIMIMTASTKLVRCKETYLKLRRFTYTLNLIITVVMLIGLHPVLFDKISMDLIGLPENVASLTHTASMLLLPWPAAIGFRRFFQGIVIFSGKTRLVAYSTVVRLSSMSLTALLLYSLTQMRGANVGAIALSAGVIFEAICIRIMAAPYVKKVLSVNSDITMSTGYLLKFYYPLALTSFLALGVHPIVTFFMGQSYLAVESLAVIPVVNSLVFIFRSVGLSYQEVVLAMIDKGSNAFSQLKKFAIILGTGSSLLLALVTFTPFSYIWFSIISGLPADLLDVAVTPAKILTILPALSVLISWQRAILVNAGNTSPITFATVAEISGIIGVLFFGIKSFTIPGATVAATSYIFGRILANSYFVPPYIKSVSKITV